GVAGGQDNGVEFFEKRIRPVLSAKCYACHMTSKLGGLRLDSRDAILAGGNSGPVIVPGKPDNSLLIREVAQGRMPKTGEHLTAQEIADLTSWIQAGAPWPESAPAKSMEWSSFQPLRAPEPPAVKNAGWVRTPIDRFILAKLEDHNLRPVKPAGKQALIRRATFDLTGLPPTPEQVEAFVADNSPDAFS